MRKQYLKDRTNQDIRDCRETVQNKKEKTALARHHLQKNHNLNLEEIEVVDC